MKISRAKLGLTLVELMVAMATCVVLMIPLALLITNADYAVRLGHTQIANQSGVSTALMRVGYVVRSGSQVTVSLAGDQVDVDRIINGSLQWRKTFLVQNGALKLRQAGLNDEILIPSGIASLTFSYVQVQGRDNNAGVTVDIAVGTGQERVTARSSFTARNAGF